MLETGFMRNIEKIFEESQFTGELILTGRKLKHFPRNSSRFDLIDLCKAELSHNLFSDVPAEVCSFISLEFLNLSHNSIKSLPFAITDLKELVELNISSNQLSSLPGCICEQLHHLQILILSGNKLSSIPDEIGQLLKLSLLDVSNNELTQLPNQIGDLCSLKDLNLRKNMLIELPICLSRLMLQKLDISCNRIAHIPCDFRKVTTLEVIKLEGNPFVSPPAQLCLRGLVHIMKFLNKEATKHESRSSIAVGGSLHRRMKRSSSFSTTIDRSKSYNIGNTSSLFYNNVINNTSTNYTGNHVNIYNNISNNNNHNNLNSMANPSTSFKSSMADYYERSKSLKGDILSNVASFYIEECNINGSNNNMRNHVNNMVSLQQNIANNSNNSNKQSSLTCDNRRNIDSNNNNSNNIGNKTTNNSTSISAYENIMNNNNISLSLTSTTAAVATTTTTASKSNKLASQASAASHQLEVWLTGLQHSQQRQNNNNNSSSNNNLLRSDKPNLLDARNKHPDNDAISKELQRQKAEYESKKKKVELLKQKLDTAKNDAERNIILQHYLNEVNSINNNLTINGSSSGSSTTKSVTTDCLVNGSSAEDKQSASTVVSPSSASSSSSTSLPSCPNGWPSSNANTLPRCGSGREAVEQAKPKSKLQNFKVPVLRKSTAGVPGTTQNSSEDNARVNGAATNSITSNLKTNSSSNNTNQSKTSANRLNGLTSSGPNNVNAGSKPDAAGSKSRDVMNDKEKAQVEKMRKSMETLLKTNLPFETLESSLKDGVILCHLINVVRPRAVPCIHVTSHTAPVLSAPKVRRNVDNFLQACRKFGVDQSHICAASSVTDDFNIVAIATTVNALISSSSSSPSAKPTVL